MTRAGGCRDRAERAVTVLQMPPADAAEQAVVQQPVGLAHGPAELHPGMGVAAVGDDDVVLAVHVPVELVDQTLRMDGLRAAGHKGHLRGDESRRAAL